MVATIKLDPWQVEFIGYEGDCILCTGRQIGKTYALAQKAKKRMVEKPGTNIIIVSLSEDQAKLIINMILVSLEETNKRDIAKGIGMVTQNKITLKNKSMALARPVGTTGDAIRGFTGDVLIIDEGSRFPELAFTAGEPTLLSTGGEVWMASTPFGKKGYFWEQYNAVKKQDETEVENDMGWKVIHVNGEKAIHERPISEYWHEEKRAKAIKRLKSMKKRWSSLRYGQEILAEFLDDLRRLFSKELLDARLTLDRPENPRSIPGKNYLGCDIARLGEDLGSYEIINELSGRYKHLESLTSEKFVTTETENMIIKIADLWKARKVGIDAGAGTLGVSVLDHLRNTALKHKLIPMNNRAISLEDDQSGKQRFFKEDMYLNLLSMMEHGEIDLLDDLEVRRSFESVQIDFSEKEKSLTKTRIFGNDTHIVEGIIRAAFLAQKEKSLNLWAR